LLSKQIVVVLIMVTIPALGISVVPAIAADRAAFERSMNEIASAVHHPNPVAYLVGIGDFYCRMKLERGGGPLDIQTASAELHRSRSDSGGSADQAAAEDAALNEANKLLCPD